MSHTAGQSQQSRRQQSRLGDVPAQLAEFARSLRGTRRSVPQTLDAILASALALIDGADSGCVTTVNRGVRTVEAATDQLSKELCRTQYELGEGPVSTEVKHLDVVVAADLGDEERWPQFAAAAMDEGVRSLAAFQLYSTGEDVGALVLYSRRTEAFGPTELAVGEALAAHAAVALLGARDNEQFLAGLASRDIIGQAKGMIMERYNIDALAAFELLAKLSQQQNRSLHLVARELVEADHPSSAAAQ